MNQQQAIEVLISAVRLANKRGAFELEESEQVNQAVKAFLPPPEAAVEETEEEEPKKSNFPS